MLTKGVRHVFRARPSLLAATLAVGLTASVAATAGAPKADIAVTAVDLSDPVLVDRDLTYRVAVLNLGPQRASRVKLALTVMGPAQLVSRPSSAGASCVLRGSSQATCSWSTIASKRRAIANVPVDPTGMGVVSLGAVVSSATVDGKRRNNSVVHTTRVVGLDSVQSRRDAPLRHGPCTASRLSSSPHRAA